MNRRLRWITIASAVILAAGIIAVALLGRFEWIDGMIAGGLIAMAGFSGLSLLLGRLIREGQLVMVAVLMPLKLALIGGAVLLVLFVFEFSSIGLLFGLANVPAAIVLANIYGLVKPPANDD